MTLTENITVFLYISVYITLYVASVYIFFSICYFAFFLIVVSFSSVYVLLIPAAPFFCFVKMQLKTYVLFSSVLLFPTFQNIKYIEKVLTTNALRIIDIRLYIL